MNDHELRIDLPPASEDLPGGSLPPSRGRAVAAGELIPPTASSAPSSAGSSACDPSALARVMELAAAAVAALRGVATATPPTAEEGPGLDQQGQVEDPSAMDPSEALPAGQGAQPAGSGGDFENDAAPAAWAVATGPRAELPPPSGQPGDGPSPADATVPYAAEEWQGDPNAWDAAGPSEPGGPTGPPLHGLALLLSGRAAPSESAESDIANTGVVRGGSIDEIE